MRGWSGHNNKLQPMLATLSYLGRQITQLLYNRMPTSQDNSNVDHSCAANHQLPFIVPFKGRADPSSGAPDGIQNDSRCNCIATISVPPYAHHPNMHCGGQPADNVFSQSVQVHPSEMPLLTISILYSCVLCRRLLCIWRPIGWMTRVCAQVANILKPPSSPIDNPPCWLTTQAQSWQHGHLWSSVLLRQHIGAGLKTIYIKR